MRIEQVGDGVHFVEGEAVNWTILADGDDITLIDAGYPGDYEDVVASIRAIGHQPDQLRAILVTHAHVDHIGSIPRLVQRWPVPVLTSETEARHARREYLQQATPVDIVRNIGRPGMVGWLTHILRKGAMKKTPVASAQGVTTDTALDVPGAPVPILLPGHTSGHTVYLVADGRAIVMGDAIATDHWLCATPGPQLLPAFFDHDRQQAITSLGTLADKKTDAVLPGHGPLYAGSVADAVRTALVDFR
jgi:glyoxylase-like metal-dependent hydrolase (beta-lactamase superfamily II)